MSGLFVSVWRELHVRDDKGTLVASFPNTDFANLRCSTMQVTKAGQEVSEAGYESVREKAESVGAAVTKDGDKALCTYSAPSSQDSQDTVQYWHIGIGGNIAIVSLFVDHRFESDARVNQMRAAAIDLVDSVRHAS
jgi:hypothetical protein